MPKRKLCVTEPMKKGVKVARMKEMGYNKTVKLFSVSTATLKDYMKRPGKSVKI